MHLSRVILISVLIVAFAGCGKQEASKGPGEESAPVPAGTRIDTNDAVQETRSVNGKPDWPTVEIDEGSLVIPFIDLYQSVDKSQFTFRCSKSLEI